MTDPADPPARALAELVARVAQILRPGGTGGRTEPGLRRLTPSGERPVGITGSEASYCG